VSLPIYFFVLDFLFLYRLFLSGGYFFYFLRERERERNFCKFLIKTNCNYKFYSKRTSLQNNNYFNIYKLCLLPYYHLILNLLISNKLYRNNIDAIYQLLEDK
jgi:hypothetical protein